MDRVFVGRKHELSQLNLLFKKKTASIVVIRGRRRVGKSRLVEEFAKKRLFYRFSGLPPQEGISAQIQRDEFMNQLSQQTDLPNIKADDWSKIFLLLFEKIKSKQVIVLFDEISWMGSEDPSFLGKLKNAWDLHFQKNPQLILVLCGSVSTWIEKNILKSTGFFGRISEKITLEGLPLHDCNTLLESNGVRCSPQEKFMILSVTGAIPWYLEQVTSALSAAENIKRLCFMKDGLLVDEFKYIFDDLFGRRKEICKKIVEVLANGAAEYNEIASVLNYPGGGPLTEYLNDLTFSGFIARHYCWSFKTGLDIKLSKFRLSDNYLRFYLKFIFPRLSKINTGKFSDVSLSSLPGFDSIMGLQFENLVLANRQLLYKALGLKPEEIIADNPFFQHATSKQKGCQIDYLIQTKYNTLYACEIKFSQKKLALSVVNSTKEKLSCLSVPKGFCVVPVLVHINGISSAAMASDFFGKMVDFSELLLVT